MEIALGGIILLIILLPEISFRKGYFSEEFSNQYTIRDFFQLFINTLFPSLFSYLLFLPIIYFIFGYYYDFKILLGILSSSEKLVENSINSINDFKFEILLFQVIINSVSFAFGYKLKDLILKIPMMQKINFSGIKMFGIIFFLPNLCYFSVLKLN